MNYKDIPQFTRSGAYEINMPWDMLERWISSHDNEGYDLQIDPDFQRAHVWTESQQVDYIEFCLRGGKTGKHVYWNCPGWMRDFRGPLVLVDGKQRIESVRKWMRDELVVFGVKCSQIQGGMPLHLDFRFNVNDLPDRASVLQWYLEMNTGGTPHSDEEIERVRNLLRLELRQ